MHTDTRPLVVILVGPTAVGKTELALSLASVLQGEIVSADSRLFYRGMDIGTAKPSREERVRVPHHLIDIVEPNKTLSLADFRSRVQQSIAGIVARGKLPLLVGGTGQYVEAVRAGWNPPPVAPNERLRLQLTRLGEDRGAGWLHDRLAYMDAPAAGKIEPRNLRRTVRALEVILLTGRRFSEQRGASEIPYRLLTIGLRRSRHDLYARIDARIDAMLQDGLIEETRQLLRSGYGPDLPAFSAIGYSQCAQVINGDIDLRQARLQMQRLTRMFVRRQSNWFKESDPTITWFDATRPDLVPAVSTLIERSCH